MSGEKDITTYFQKDEQVYFDFSLAPTLIRLKDRNTLEKKIVPEKEELSQWAKAQDSFLRRAKDKKVFTQQDIESGKIAYDAFFEQRDRLRGNILDIGGGWGLFRQWWDPGESGVFVVHDPGFERFLDGPHRLHEHLYETGFSLPMTFVEGFGEELPYESNSFDTCLIAHSLDHVIYPQKVCAEAYRVLGPGGTILIMSAWHSDERDSLPLHILKRLRKHIHNPKHLLSIFYNSIFHRYDHVHRFSAEDIPRWLEQVGFSNIRVIAVPVTPATQNVRAFEAIKEPLDFTD